ncbi:hypothetical protein B9Z65_1141 [Elsinoe australis]|uniref:C2H2-type domain-containing protein n=1 Tax=Elsinoe australis TaxID=40998 RepID=A0A2P8AIE5_9PEZI|nr:hypothetical protein B9Z65_1141 [Elsinoe australis]
MSDSPLFVPNDTLLGDSDGSSSDDDGGVDIFCLNTGLGKQSLDAMVDNSLQLRKQTKATVKSLDPFGTLPQVRENTKRTVTRFNRFRVDVLRKDLKEPFDTLDLVRFLDALVTIVVPKSVCNTKAVPSVRTVLGWICQVMRWATFQYPDLKLQSSKVKAFISGLIRDKKVISGIWRESIFLGFATVRRMSWDWLNDAVVNGTRSMDVTVFRLLSVILCSSMGARSGDIALSQGYSTECLVWSDIVITYCDEATKFCIEDLVATITLRAAKGHKWEHNASTIKHLSAMPPSSAHVCPIRLLIVHALRNSLVHATSFADVLQQMATRNDRTLVWACPAYPVIYHITTGGFALETSKPAPAASINTSVKSIGRVSGILAHTYSHALRKGYARDVAHLTTPVVGTVTPAVTEALGHALDGMKRITAGYVGGMSTDLNAAREQNKHVSHRREPRFAEPKTLPKTDRPFFIRPRIDHASLQTFMTEKWPAGYKGIKDFEALSESQQRNVRKHLKRSLDDAALESATVESPADKKAKADRQPLMPLDKNAFQLRPDRGSVKGNSRQQISSTSAVSDSMSDPRQRLATGLVPDSMSGPSQPLSADESDFASLVDPRLRRFSAEASGPISDPRPLQETDGIVEASVSDDEDLSELDDAANFFIDIVSRDPQGHDHVQQSDSTVNDKQYDSDVDDICAGKTLVDDSISDLLDVTDSGPPVCSDQDFVTYFSEYNVCKSDQFGNEFQLHSGDLTKMQNVRFLPRVTGGSRNDPTPWSWLCPTPGCGARFPALLALTIHGTSCTPAVVQRRSELAARESISCPQPGCTHIAYSIDGPSGRTAEASLDQHHREQHAFVPRHCPTDGCTDLTIFTNIHDFKQHQNRAHYNTRIIPCPQPDCDKTYKSKQKLKTHLLSAHGITDTDKLKRLADAAKPRAKKSRPAKPSTKYQPHQCGVDGCKLTPKLRVHHVRHLIRVHNFSEADAEAAVPQGAFKTRRRTKKKNNDDENDDDGDDGGDDGE